MRKYWLGKQLRTTFEVIYFTWLYRKSLGGEGNMEIECVGVF